MQKTEPTLMNMPLNSASFLNCLYCGLSRIVYTRQSDITLIAYSEDVMRIMQH